jgi:predicted RNase H-like HicB family nuclease
MAKKKFLSDEFREKAEQLAMQPYLVLVMKDTTIHGDPIYLAVNQEIEGCMAHGKTSKEAIENLREARADYIQVCLLSNVPIPTPTACEEIYTSPSESIIKTISYNSRKKENLENLIVEVAQPEKRDVITKYVFKVLPCEA